LQSDGGPYIYVQLDWICKHWPTPKEQLLFLCILSGQGQLHAYQDRISIMTVPSGCGGYLLRTVLLDALVSKERKSVYRPVILSMASGRRAPSSDSFEVASSIWLRSLSVN
jgi:hypothetical protein